MNAISGIGVTTPHLAFKQVQSAPILSAKAKLLEKQHNKAEPPVYDTMGMNERGKTVTAFIDGDEAKEIRAAKVKMEEAEKTYIDTYTRILAENGISTQDQSGFRLNECLK